jgi:hypothetical protein
MIGFELNNCLQKIFHAPTTISFLGTYDIDKFSLPLDIDKSWLVALNSGDRHWLCMCFDAQKQKIAFLDSLAFDVANYSLNLSICLQDLFGAVNLLHLPYRIQGFETKSCGFFVIYFAHCLRSGTGFLSLFSQFSSSDFGFHEELLHDWIEQHFPHLLE